MGDARGIPATSDVFDVALLGTLMTGRSGVKAKLTLQVARIGFPESRILCDAWVKFYKINPPGEVLENSVFG